jgi:hypothetical protein
MFKTAGGMATGWRLGAALWRGDAFIAGLTACLDESMLIVLGWAWHGKPDSLPCIKQVCYRNVCKGLVKSRRIK